MQKEDALIIFSAGCVLIPLFHVKKKKTEKITPTWFHNVSQKFTNHPRRFLLSPLDFVAQSLQLGTQNYQTRQSLHIHSKKSTAT